MSRPRVRAAGSVVGCSVEDGAAGSVVGCSVEVGVEAVVEPSGSGAVAVLAAGSCRCDFPSWSSAGEDGGRA